MSTRPGSTLSAMDETSLGPEEWDEPDEPDDPEPNEKPPDPEDPDEPPAGAAELVTGLFFQAACPMPTPAARATTPAAAIRALVRPRCLLAGGGVATAGAPQIGGPAWVGG